MLRRKEVENVEGGVQRSVRTVLGQVAILIGVHDASRDEGRGLCQGVVPARVVADVIHGDLRHPAIRLVTDIQVRVNGEALLDFVFGGNGTERVVDVSEIIPENNGTFCHGGITLGIGNDHVVFVVLRHHTVDCSRRFGVDLVHRVGDFTGQVSNQALVAHEASNVGTDTARNNLSGLRQRVVEVDRLPDVGIPGVRTTVRTIKVVLVISVGLGVFVVPDIQEGHTEHQVLVQRIQFQVCGQGILVKSSCLGSTPDVFTGEEVTFGTGRIETFGAAEAGKETFGTEFTQGRAHVRTELEVDTLQIALVTFDEGFLLGHLAVTCENRRFVHDVDTGHVHGQRRILLTEVTCGPVEILADVAFEVNPGSIHHGGGVGEVVLHAGIEA